MAEIIFDAATHTYTVDGIVRPSVTQIIKAAGLMENEAFYSVEARDRGTAVHQACWYLDENDLDEQWLEASPLAGYVRAWIRFKQETRTHIELIEQRVFNPSCGGYCGTVDRTATIGTVRALIDIKTGGPEPWHRLQSVAYSACFPHARAMRRMTVHLRDNGTYSVIEHRTADFTRDWLTFQAAAQIWHWKNESGRNIGTSNDNRTAAA